MSNRVGIGFDIHPLVAGKKLVLGGVTIPYSQGLSGWSDADVLIHAIIDALLGAAAMGDIGKHFPPGEPQYHDISSLVLLENVREKITAQGWQIINIDSTIVAEKPRLSEYTAPICQKLSQALKIPLERISVKAKTSAGLGFVGEGQGITAHAIVLLEGN